MTFTALFFRFFYVGKIRNDAVLLLTIGLKYSALFKFYQKQQYFNDFLCKMGVVTKEK
jgi:hypothetical protein